MKRMDPIRAAFAVMATAVAGVAQADTGGVSPSGWLSVLGVVGVTGVLYWVHLKVR